MSAGECAEGPDEFRQVYGLTDTVLPFPFGADGDQTWPVVFWRTQFGCGAASGESAYSVVERRTFTRTVWDCDGGDVVSDVHPGGHLIPRGWIGRQLDELLGLEPQYP